MTACPTAAPGRPFGRVLTAMITPFDAAGALDLDRAVELAHFLVDSGSDGLVLSVLSAMHQVFPAYRIFATGMADMLVVASKQPVLPSPDWSVFTRPPVTAQNHSPRWCC